MTTGLAALCAAYVLSQFFRAFLAVLATPLATDIGAGPDALARASGYWFLAFALMQLPVGWALDRIGPRRTASALLAMGGGGGAALFALAQGPGQISVAMLLIGVGCSPVLMASYYIFAREFPPARFATLAALMLGVGSAGNLMASYPTALAAEMLGWRFTLAGLAALSIAIALVVHLTVRDPEPLEEEIRGSLLDLLRNPLVWPIIAIMAVNYAPSGALRGLWIGPYLTDTFGLNTHQVGLATLLLGTAMIVGVLAAGPLDRTFGTRKWVIFALNIISGAAILALGLFADAGLLTALILITIVGLASGSFPVVIAHGRSLFPPHLVGRGVTLLNLFGIGGVGVMQMISARIHEATAPVPAHAPYQIVFAFFGVALLAGSLIYLFSRDSMD